jgi:hypothetical protein
MPKSSFNFFEPQAFAKGSDWTEIFAQQILNALLEGLLE